MKTLIAAVIILGASLNQANALPLKTETAAYKMEKNSSYKINRTWKEKHADFNSKERILKQARDLESVLISKMIEPMFPSGEDSDLYGGGPGSDVFRSMMIDQYGEIMTKAEGLGIASNIADKLEN